MSDNQTTEQKFLAEVWEPDGTYHSKIITDRLHGQSLSDWLPWPKGRHKIKITPITEPKDE